MEWIHLAQSRGKCQVLVNTLIRVLNNVRRLAEELLAPQKQHCPMELVTFTGSTYPPHK